ncbi:hypothetical protein RR46_00245 [Papilio xuthus]|uniref:Uncharacterized protein n=1 Tax=Papilio xuthus TaxID=66420 RepID=A0A0N1IN75_PAPXU|nr:hypothetical protein RR46_00245 [Papilio xuthus]
MCPIWPLHIVILYILALCPIWVMCQSAPNLLATFKPNNLSLHMAYYDFIDVEVKGDGLQPADEFQIKSRNHHVAYGDWNSTYRVDEAASNWKGRFQVTAEFLGKSYGFIPGSEAWYYRVPGERHTACHRVETSASH